MDAQLLEPLGEPDARARAGAVRVGARARAGRRRSAPARGTAGLSSA